MPAAMHAPSSGRTCRSATTSLAGRMPSPEFVDATGRPGTGDLGSGHVPRRHRRSPGRRRELVRGRCLRPVPRQGAARRPITGTAPPFAERAAGIARVGDHRREQFRWDGHAAGWQAPAALDRMGPTTWPATCREWLWNVSPNGRWIGGRRMEPGPVSLQRARRGARLGPFARQRLSLHAHAARAGLRRAAARADRADVGRLRVAVAGRGRRLLRCWRSSSTTQPSGPRSAVSSRSISTNSLWTRERITLATGYDDTRFALQPVPAGWRRSPLSGDLLRAACRLHERDARVERLRSDRILGQPLDFILEVGPRARRRRARRVVRTAPGHRSRRESMSTADRYRIRLRHARQDLGRAIDYLATRKDIDSGRLGWFGVS